MTIWSLLYLIWIGVVGGAIGAMFANIGMGWLSGDLRSKQDWRDFFAFWLCAVALCIILPITIVGFLIGKAFSLRRKKEKATQV